MKRRDVERELRRLGWELKSHGGRHDKWSNGVDTVMVPRHVEIKEHTARVILRIARGEQ